MNHPLNVGLIGFGMSGRVFHAPMINAVSELRLAKVVERHTEESKRTYPWVEVVKDIDDVLKDAAIDVVAIATPNSSHFELTKRALLAGKHTVVDKPFTITSHEAQQLIDLSNQTNKLLSVFQNRRWDSSFKTVQKVINLNIIGELVEYESHFDRFKNQIKQNAWRETSELGSGVVYDLGTHLIDQAQVLFGLPKLINGDIRTQRKGGVADDSFEVILDYNHLKVTLKSGMLVRETGPSFSLHGTEGSFIKYGLDPQEDALKRGETPLNTQNWGQEPEEAWGLLNTQLNGLHYRGKIESLAGSYQSFYKNIYDVIAKGQELIVKPEEARNTIRIIELALESNRQKRSIEFSL
jgi:predicted dehydrogenase